MSLLSMLETEKPRGRTDKVLDAYESLPPGEKDAFALLIQDDTWSAPQLAEALQRLGHDIQAHQLTYFRTKLKTGRVTL